MSADVPPGFLEQLGKIVGSTLDPLWNRAYRGCWRLAFLVPSSTVSSTRQPSAPAPPATPRNQPRPQPRPRLGGPSSSSRERRSDVPLSSPITKSTSRESRANIPLPPAIAKSTSGQTTRSSGSAKRDRSPEPVETAAQSVKKQKKKAGEPDVILTDRELDALTDEAFREYQAQFRAEHRHRPFTPDSEDGTFYRFAPGLDAARFPDIAEWAIQHLDQPVEYCGSHRVSRCRLIRRSIFLKSSIVCALSSSQRRRSRRSLCRDPRTRTQVCAVSDRCEGLLFQDVGRQSSGLVC